MVFNSANISFDDDDEHGFPLKTMKPAGPIGGISKTDSKMLKWYVGLWN